jgi:hypothetical protein
LPEDAVDRVVEFHQRPPLLRCAEYS